MLRWIAMHGVLVRVLAMPGGLAFGVLVALAALNAHRQYPGRHRKALGTTHAMPFEVRHHRTATGTHRGELSRCSAQFGATGTAVVRDEHPTSHVAPADDTPTVVIERELAGVGA